MAPKKNRYCLKCAVEAKVDSAYYCVMAYRLQKTIKRLEDKIKKLQISQRVKK